MRFLPALVALVAFGTHATAAQIPADQPELTDLSMLSLASSAEILRVPISPDLVLDERAITSALEANAAQGHGMPEPAVFEVMGAGFGLLAVFAWHRHAISRIHRPGYTRKRRYEHPMAWI